MPRFVENARCRFCRRESIEAIFNLGDLSISGVFLQDGNEVMKLPVVLGFCEKCQLVQLKHNYDLQYVFTSSYGYESGLNSTMANHLISKASNLQKKYQINTGFVVDIASNDGTLLSGYSRDVISIGIDPLIPSVSNRYPDNSIKIPHFFSKESYFSFVKEKATLVTSNSVIYDLDNPILFAKDVNEILEENGIWHFEQSYLPTMLSNLSIDTICHEHLLYLSYENIEYMLEESGFKCLEAELNDINGGSIAITAIKSKTKVLNNSKLELFKKNEKENLKNLYEKLETFASQALEQIQQIREIINDYRERGFAICGLGASTKGNILLSILGLNESQVEFIGDINSKKHGLRTPGTNIPIVPEASVLEIGKPCVAILLPWHFARPILQKCHGFLERGNVVLIPFPSIELKTKGQE